MRTLAATISLFTVSALTLFGQGRVLFNNLEYPPGLGITVNISNQGPSGGAAGAFLGSNYSIELQWAPFGNYVNEIQFAAAALGSSAPVNFFGSTGGSPTTDRAGLFDGGAVPNPIGTSMPAGNYSMMVWAWFNNGQFATYQAAKAANRNTGYGIFNQSATAFPADPPNTLFAPFSVRTVPEPSTFVLAGLGAVCLMILRRRR